MSRSSTQWSSEEEPADPTSLLLAAGERLIAEAARRFPIAGDRHDRAYWMDAMIQEAPVGLFFKDRDGRFLIANKATAAHIGGGRDDLTGLTDFDLFPREVAQVLHDCEQQIITTGEPVLDMEECFRDVAGRRKWVLTSKLPMRNDHGEIVGIVGIARDITDRKRQEALHRGQAEILQMIARGEALSEVFPALILLIEEQVADITGSILLIDHDGQCLRHASAPNLHPDYTRAIDGAPIGPSVGSCGTAAYRGEPVLVADIAEDPLWADYRHLVRPYRFRACWSSPIRSSQGQVLGTFALYSRTPGLPTAACHKLLGVATHIAGIAIERKEAEDRIQFMAHHDALTGLPNRGMLDERIATAIEIADDENRSVALAFLDLDNFKLVNDSLGHKAGDTLLKTVAARMAKGLRPGDVLVRLGGDEFVLIVSAPRRNGKGVAARLEAVRQTIAAPVTLEGRTVQVSCSMGVALYPEHGRTPTELLANADLAMYRAKEIGRDALHFFSNDMAVSAHEKLRQQEELRRAIARDEFVLHYQPQVDLRTGNVFAVEALIRWNHPERGLLPPGEFIPFAEESGLIGQIGDWTLRAACRQNKAWQDAGLPRLVVSVNVSARQFQEIDWVERVRSALSDSGLDARYLELELTESLIMADVQQAVALMYRLEALGVHLAIDDFGTGYSSLSALKRFPVGRLKIDRSFVQDLPADADDAAIARAVISLAHTLQLRVIAEGVETREQLEFLREAGCNEIQGFYIGRPVEAAAIEARLNGMAA